MKCAICGCEIKGFGNNPYPVRAGEDDRCCDICDNMYVIPYRILMMGTTREQAEEITNLLNKCDTDELDRLLEGMR